MFIKIICIFALLEFSLSEYDAEILPMEKDSKYGDDVCSYTDDKQKYVKPCEKGKFCGNLNSILTLDYSRGKYYDESNIEICQDLPNITSLYTYNEGSCTNDFECEGSYKCIGNICSYKCDAGEFYSYIGCKDNSDKGNDGICYEKNIKNDGSMTYRYSPPVPNKKCEKLTFADDPRDTKKGIYYVHQREYVYEGEVEDGEYVNDVTLCKSGFALYFFKDGKSEDPRDESETSSYNTMYLRCVTPISVSEKNAECFINYKINENEILRYNVEKLDSLTNNPPSNKYSNIKNFCNEFYEKYIKIKYEKYKEYYTKITEEERKTCGDLDSSNQYTCENNELIKLWYFYNHPADYFTYNNRKKIGKVIDYNIQKAYPCYSLSQFLSIKFISLLFLLLF